MSQNIFVGREKELSLLAQSLTKTANGALQVVFLSGEAGAGKSSLIEEFIRRAEEADAKLITSIGECNAQTGAGDPYLPFREILTSLTTEPEAEKSSAAAVKTKKATRLKEIVRVSTQTLIMLGPDLIGIFVPGASFLTRIATTTAFNSNVALKLSEKVGKKAGAGTDKIDPTLDQAKIFEQYSAVMKAMSKEHTLVLVLDDLQWADSGSLNLFFHLVRELKESRILIVGTFRPDDVALGREGARHPLESIVNELKRYHGDIVMDLSQKGAEEGRRFVDALVDAEPNQLGEAFRKGLSARTGGHPLFTVELLRDMQERGNLVKDADDKWIEGPTLDWATLPARVDGVIGERIARLPADLRETLTISGVMGYDFTAQVVARVQKMEPRAMIKNLSRELEARYRLVAEQGETKIGKDYVSHYHFSHALIQQYLYQDLGAGERRILHGEIAETLEDLYVHQTDEIALQLAHHFDEAGNEEKAIAYWFLAGDAAFHAYAYEEAITAFSRALELGKNAQITGQQLKHLYTRRGRAMELNGQFEQALQNYDEMLKSALKKKDRQLELASKVAASTLYSTPTAVADAAKGQQLSEETLKLAGELGDRAAEAQVLWNLQLVNLLQNNAALAIDFGERSLAIARELNLRELMAYTLSDLGWAYNDDCQFEKAAERLDEGARIWQELSNVPMLANNLNVSLFGYLWNGNYDKVLSVSEQAYQISLSSGSTWNQASARMFQGEVWLQYGEVDRALTALRESVQFAEQANAPIYVTWFHAILCRAYSEMGLIQQGMEIFRRRLVPYQSIPISPAHTATLVSYACFEITSGQLDAAATALDACHGHIPIWESMIQLAKCKLALARAEWSHAIAISDAAVELTRHNHLHQYLPEALFLSGKAHVLNRENDLARIAFEQARIEAETLGSRRLLWQIFAELAALEADSGKSAALGARAREHVQFMAEHISNEDLRTAFLRHTAQRIKLT